MTTATIAPAAPYRSLPAESRALLASVAASLVLHLALLVLFPEVRFSVSNAAGSRMLIARLAPRVEAPEPVALPKKAPAEENRRSEPRRERDKAETQPKQTPRESALAAPAPGTLPVQEAQARLPAPASEDSGARAQPATATLAAPQVRETPAPSETLRQPASRPAPAADAQTLDQYRLALIGVARHYKRYPARAVENGWQGKVEVRLVIGANGSTQKASIKTSSGYEILDKEALDMIRKAKPLAPIPQSLRGREFTVDIPVIFDLQTG